MTKTGRILSSQADSTTPRASTANGIRIGGPILRMRIKKDAVLFYSPIPLGWNGPPAHFAALGDAVRKIHASYGLVNPSWDFGRAF